MIHSETGTEIGDQESLRYELLRFRVLGNNEEGSKGNLGLAMFLRQGMLTWISTWHKYDSASSSKDKKIHQLPILPFKVQSEMTRVLANMTLFNLGESGYENTINRTESYCKSP